MSRMILPACLLLMAGCRSPESQLLNFCCCPCPEQSQECVSECEMGTGIVPCPAIEALPTIPYETPHPALVEPLPPPTKPYAFPSHSYGGKCNSQMGSTLSPRRTSKTGNRVRLLPMEKNTMCPLRLMRMARKFRQSCLSQTVAGDQHEDAHDFRELDATDWQRRVPT